MPCGHEASCGYASDILYICLMPKINSHQDLLILKEKENNFPCYAMEINSIFCAQKYIKLDPSMPCVRNDTLKGTSDKPLEGDLASKSNQATGMGAGAHPAEVLIPAKAGAEASTPAPVVLACTHKGM